VGFLDRFRSAVTTSPTSIFPAITEENAQHCEGCNAVALARNQLPPIYPFPEAFTVTLTEWKRVDPDRYWHLYATKEDKDAAFDASMKHKKRLARPARGMRPHFHDCNACVGFRICPTCFELTGDAFQPRSYVNDFLSSTWHLYDAEATGKPAHSCVSCRRDQFCAKQSELVSVPVARLKLTVRRSDWSERLGKLWCVPSFRGASLLRRPL
jgi:hypothetical protein